MKRKRLRQIVLGCVLVLLIAVATIPSITLPPHGRFSTPGVGNTADAYYEATNGKFYLVVFDGETGREGEEHRKFIGDYRKEDGRWILVTSNGHTGELRATLLSLTILQPPVRPAGPFYRYGIFTMR